MKSKLISGTHHIALKTRGEVEFQKAVDFYAGLLGLEEIRSWVNANDRGVMLSTGNSIIEITSNGMEANSQGSIRHFALATEDVDACIQLVREAGYPIVMEPKDVVISSDPVLPIRIGFCLGPVGEEIEFFCEK